MIYVAGLVLALSALWFALSGETAPLFLGFGALSILLALWLAARLKIIDRNASPYHRIAQVLLYLVWLSLEVVKANLAVIRSVLDPRRTISPALVKVKANGRTDLAKAMFANSITLTPGTVTVDVERDGLLVHALHEQNARPAAFAPMDRRSARAAERKLKAGS
jgi:multicomponent Na+:H+ antiporter subunit E